MADRNVEAGSGGAGTSDSTTAPMVLKDLSRFLMRQDTAGGGATTTTTTNTTTNETTTRTSGDGGGDDDDDAVERRRQHPNEEEYVSLFDKSVTAVPVAAIKALLGVVQRSKAGTMMELQGELNAAANAIINHSAYGSGDGTQADEEEKSSKTSSSSSKTTTSLRSSYRLNNIALRSGCELFLKYVTRTFLELPDFDQCKREVLIRGERFHMISMAARDRIADIAVDFIPHSDYSGGSNVTTILSHGYSRVVASILYEASRNRNRHFDLVLLEGRPDASGVKAAQCYCREADIPVRVVLDSAVGYIMEQVDMVLIGAEGVVENGGIVNKIGTYAIAVCAKAAGKPFYVAAESYKFTRMYPLHQSDLPQPPAAVPRPFDFVDTRNLHPSHRRQQTQVTADQDDKDQQQDQEPQKQRQKQQQQRYHPIIELDESIVVENPTVDYTPAEFITLLFTDLGVLTPSAVSDELIRLYQ